MMTLEEINWQLNLINDRYTYLNLNREQLEKLYKFENQPASLEITNGYLTDWENLDMELSFFRQILDPGQLKTYLSRYQENKLHLAESLRAQDVERENELRHHLNTYQYFRENFIPRLLSEETGLRTWRTWHHHVETKLNFLRSEYKLYLGKYKMTLLEGHFRAYRDLAPNILKIALLHLGYAHLYPDYESFRAQFDEATKSVAEFLEEHISKTTLPNEDALIQLEREKATFFEESWNKHVGPPKGGWIIFGTQDPKTENLYRKMSLLLFDPKGYDFSSPFLD